MMGVGGYSESGATGFGLAEHGGVEIQALGTGVDFQPDVAAHGLVYHSLEIEAEGLAMQQEAAGGVSHDFYGWALQRAEQAVGHLSGLQVHVAVNTADHQVELSQRVICQIERAVPQDVAFQARKNSDSQIFLVDLPHLPG